VHGKVSNVINYYFGSGYVEKEFLGYLAEWDEMVKKREILVLKK